MNKKYLTFTIINTVLCIILFFASLAILTANMMQAAAAGAEEAGIFQDLLFYFSIVYPAIPVISIIGSWIAWLKQSKKYTLIFILTPWAYSLVLAATLIGFFVSVS